MMCSQNRVGTVCGLALLAGTCLAQTDPAPADDSASLYLVSQERWHDEPKVAWDGFLSGLRGFEGFYEPIGMPIYFESPFINTSVRALYLHHEFPSGSPIAGGDLNVYALQARLALTERLAFIATKDGYSDLNAGLLPSDEGFNDIAAGLKYAFWVDREADFVATGGARWEFGSGDSEVLQGGDDEYSVFVSAAKGFGRFHTIASVTWRIPEDGDTGNHVLNWSVHLDVEALPDILPGVAPVVEVHGNHYLTNADMGPALGIGGLDYTNLGTSNIAGQTVVWVGVGARAKLSPHASIGATFEFPLTDPDDDIMGNRFTADLILTW